jgi:hypothetical protein
VADSSDFIKKMEALVQKGSSAETAIKKLKDGLASGDEKLSTFQTSMMKTASASTSGAAAVKKLGGAVLSLATGELPSATAAMTAFGQTVGGVVTAATDRLAKALAGLGPEGAAAGVAIQALGAVISATVGTFATLMGFIIDATQKAGAFRASLDALAGGAAGGAKVQAVVSKLSTSLPFATDQVKTWAAQLLAAGVPAEKLESRIKAVAAAEAIMRAAGGGGGAAAETFFKRMGEDGPAAEKFVKELAAGSRRATNTLHEMGLTIADLGGKTAVAKMSAEQLTEAVTKALAQKGKGPLSAMMDEWPTIIGKAQEGFRSLFSGLEPAVKPFMKAARELFSIFNKGGPVVAVLKPIVTEVFSKLFEWGTKALKAIRAGLLDLIIWGLKAYISLHPLITRIKEFVTSKTFIDGLKVAFVLLAAAVTLVSIPFAIAAAMAALFVAAVLVVISAVGAVAGAISDFATSTASALSEWVTSAATAASSFIDGIVSGISSGIGAAVSAVSNLGDSMKASLFGALGIHSPSRVAIEAATNVTDTTADTLDRGSAKVQTSIDDMVAPGGKGGGKGGGPSVVFTNCNFGEGLTKEQLEEWMTDIFQRQTLGAPA